MQLVSSAINIFNQAIIDYHEVDDVDQLTPNPFDEGLQGMLYHKCWIDTVQWHLEDIIRNPHIDPETALNIKRRIDRSNQDRTDIVERIDDYFMTAVAAASVKTDARLNTESPAWAIDRLSILCLKIYHMKAEVERPDADDEHRKACENKLAVLLEQQNDLSTAIEQLIQDIRHGHVRMKLYRQMKMYNDPKLNPILYQSKN